MVGGSPSLISHFFHHHSQHNTLRSRSVEMELKTITVHAGTIFDSKAKKFKENVSITVDPGTGSIVHVLQRDTGAANIREGDIDLRDKIVMPGFVDAHTHIFLHAYK